MEASTGDPADNESGSRSVGAIPRTLAVDYRKLAESVAALLKKSGAVE